MPLALGMLFVLLLIWMRSVNHSLGQLRMAQARLEALADSLQLAPPPARREIDGRIERLERNLSGGSPIVRVPEVIALRTWTRRIDFATERNRQRLATLGRTLDSLRGARTVQDTAEASATSMP
jgi:hypothetical protein